MKPEEWTEKLEAFLKVSKWTQTYLAQRTGYYKGLFSDGKKREAILPQHYDIIAQAMEISEEDFVADFERFHTALLNRWKPAWKHLLRENPADPLGASVVRFRTPNAGMRLVVIDDHPKDDDSIEIRIGNFYRIELDLMNLFERSDIEFENDADPLEGIYLYVLQVEGDECLLLRPNSNLNPKGLPDWHDSTDNDDLSWIVIIPPQRARPEGIRFSGEPGLGELYVLIRKRPMSDALQEELSSKHGARISALDNLAKELTVDGGVQAEHYNYWRLFRQAYVLKR